MAIDFPTPTQVGQVYTDPTSGNTYICVVLGPPAEWTGSSDNADLDQTYLRVDASNGPVSGNLGSWRHSGSAEHHSWNWWYHCRTEHVGCE